MKIELNKKDKENISMVSFFIIKALMLISYSMVLMTLVYLAENEYILNSINVYYRYFFIVLCGCLIAFDFIIIVFFEPKDLIKNILKKRRKKI